MFSWFTHIDFLLKKTLNIFLCFCFVCFVEASSSSNTSTQEASYLDSEPIELEIEDTDDEDDLFRRILAAAAARGIPLDFLAAHMNGGPGADSDDEDIEYPFEQPPTSLDDVATFIQSDDCRKILILAGAGMSVAR